MVLVVLLVLAVQASAQDRDRRPTTGAPASARTGGFHFGFTVGPEFSHVDLKLEDGSRSIELVVGMHFGIALAWDRWPLTIRTGVNYLNAGALFNGTDFLARDEFDVSFLTIPLDIRLSPVRRGLVRPYIFAGPELRYGLDLEARPISLTNDIRLLSATAAIGVGISLRTPRIPIRFSPEIRYATDLLGFYSGGLEKDDGGIVETAEAVKANALRIGVLLGF